MVSGAPIKGSRNYLLPFIVYCLYGVPAKGK